MRRRRAGRRPWIPILVGAAAGTVFFLGTATSLTSALRRPDGGTAITITVTAGLFGLLLVSLLRDLATALGYLFVSSDAAFLLASPARPHAIVFGRMIEAIVDALAFPLVIVLPVLWGAGGAAGAPFLYFAGALVAVLALVTISVGTGFALAIGLAPLLPARRVRIWLRTIGAFVYLSIWAGVLWTTSADDSAGGAALSGAARIAAAAPAALPSTWAAAALEALRAGRIDARAWGALACAAAALMALPLMLGARYPLAWQSARAQAGGAPRERSPLPRAAVFPRMGWGSVKRPRLLRLAGAFLWRDARQFVRDSAHVSQVVTQSVFTAALAFLLGTHTPEGLRIAALAAATIFAVQLGFELGSHTLPRERGALALLLAAPLSATRHALARAASLAAALVLATIPVALAALAAARMPAASWASSSAAIVALGAAALAGGLAIGAWHGNPAWRSPGEMLDRTGQYMSVGLFVGLATFASVSGGAGGLPSRGLALGGAVGVCLLATLAVAILIWIAIGGIASFELLNRREGLREP
jgi:hypothetical protein